jgi:hypothetical protein
LEGVYPPTYTMGFQILKKIFEKVLASILKMIYLWRVNRI